MTFYEAAVQILLREGHPLHAREITEIALRESLLSHVGKTPEETMASRLAAMAKKSHDRRLVAVDVDVFGLSEWSVEPAPGAAEQSGQPPPHDEEEPQLRGRERHPRIARENVRVSGRGDRRRKFEEAEERRKKRRLGPVAAVIAGILEKVGRPAPLFEVVAAAREQELLGEDTGKEAAAEALQAENDRREAEGKEAVFAFGHGGLLGLASWGEEPPGAAGDLAAALAAAAATVAEERRARAQAEAEPAAPERPEREAKLGPLVAAVAEQHRRTLSRLRRRLAEMDGAALDAITQKLLGAMGYREVRPVRSRPEGSLFTARRRMGLCEVRFAVRVLRGREVRREDVLELRREMGSQSCQIGVIASPGDATREARSEVSVAGVPLVTLLCADALGEQLMERGIGVRTRTVTYVELEESLRGGREEGGRESRESRDERRERRDRERREWREKRQRERAERREARPSTSVSGETSPPAEETGIAPDAGSAVPEPPAAVAETDTTPGGETR